MDFDGIEDGRSTAPSHRGADGFDDDDTTRGTVLATVTKVSITDTDPANQTEREATARSLPVVGAHHVFAIQIVRNDWVPPARTRPTSRLRLRVIEGGLLEIGCSVLPDNIQTNSIGMMVNTLPFNNLVMFPDLPLA